MFGFGRPNGEKLEGKRDVAGLTRGLASAPQVELRTQALHALVRLEQQDLVLGALGDGAAEVRAEAAHALGESRELRAELPLVLALRDHDWQVRTAAAEALGRLGDSEAEEPLLAEFEDSNSHVRAAVADLAQRFGRLGSNETIVVAELPHERILRASVPQAPERLGDRCTHVAV